MTISASGYNQKGLSLIGVIVATFIVAIGLVGILALANISIRSSSTSEMALVASGLAQEGIEVVRDIRAANPDWIDWEWYGAMATSTSQTYRFQYNSQCLTCCPTSPGSCPTVKTALKIDTTSGVYQYGSGSNSSFYRTITLTKNSSEEVKVVVEVEWQAKGETHTLTAEDRLWRYK
jgi:Tfp pilus assembly protein PilV